MDTQRVAVLVDGDNISPVHAARILAQAAKLGRVDIARTYINGTSPSDWHSMAGYQGMHAGTGKNSADMLLSIDAMEFALVQGIETFLIATSDGDFSHLAFRLREIGIHVLGMGEKKAPAGFRMACSAFQELENPNARKDTAPVSNLVAPLDLKIKAMIRDDGNPKTGIPVAKLGGRMHTKHGTLKSELSESTWHGYLSKRPALYAVDPRGPNAMVKFHPAGFQHH